MRTEQEYLEAEIAELKDMLSKLSEDRAIDRASLEARLEGARKKLEEVLCKLPDWDATVEYQAGDRVLLDGREVVIEDGTHKYPYKGSGK